ncbi:MAG: hypothetical protein JWN44_3080 [Myxococcales bacterium]|nr:hypothetical protein [Myxococcales bacterium]
MTRAASAIAVTLLLAACTRSGTGVELTVDAAGLTLDSLVIVASYDGTAVTRTVATAPGVPLTLVARLPDRATTVTFDVTAFAGSTPLAHVTSDPIAVPAHQIVPASVSFGSGGGVDAGDVDADVTLDLATVGAQWTLERGTPPPGPGAIRGIWASSGTDAYAASTNTGNVNLFHSTDHGVHWTSQQAAGMPVDLNGVGGTTASDVILIGDGATILRGANITWTKETPPVPSNTRLLGIWAIAPGNIYIAGSGNVILHGGAAGSGWIVQTTVGVTELRSVWGVAGNIWAVGSAGTILHSTGTSWALQTSGTGAELRAVFGTSATDVWVVGDGVVLHSTNGTTWAPAAEGVPAGVSLRALGGRPAGPVWAAGTGFTILRRDVSTWVVETTGLPVDDPAADRLNALYAPSLADVFAGGDGQILLHRP